MRSKERKHHIHTNGEIGGNTSEMRSDIECATRVSANDVWKVNGLRRNYRSLSANSPLAPNIRSEELADGFAAAGKELQGQESGHPLAQKHTTDSKGQHPHIASLYFLEEMKRFH